jgi:hypothetical protein
MAKKFISGENLIYALNEFEKQMKEMVESVTDIIAATKEDIEKLFEELYDDV